MMITSSSSPQTSLQCLLNPAVRSVARRRAAPLLAALGLGSKRGDHDADQEEDDADREEDAWNTFMYFDVIVFLMTILQASTGRPRWRSNLVKPQMFPSVFQTVFPPVEI